MWYLVPVTPALRGWGGRIASSLQLARARHWLKPNKNESPRISSYHHPYFSPLPVNQHLSTYGFSLSLICFLWISFYLFEKNIVKESIFYKQPFSLRTILWGFKEITVCVHRLPFLISGWGCGHSTVFRVTILASSHWGYSQHLLF